jgi:hypothetical protein
MHPPTHLVFMTRTPYFFSLYTRTRTIFAKRTRMYSTCVSVCVCHTYTRNSSLHTRMHIHTYIHTHAPGSARPTAAGAELRRGGGGIHVAVVARTTAAADGVPRLLPTPMPIYVCSSKYTKYSCYTHQNMRAYMITYTCMYTHTYIHLCIYVCMQKETHRKLNAPGAARQKMLNIATSLGLLQLLHLFRV